MSMKFTLTMMGLAACLGAAFTLTIEMRLNSPRHNDAALQTFLSAPVPQSTGIGY